MNFPKWLALSVLLLAGCAQNPNANQSNKVWDKPNATLQDFDGDKAACQQQTQKKVMIGRGATARSALSTDVPAYNACMEARGWVLKDKEAVAKDREQMNKNAQETFKAWKQKSDEICASAEFKIITDKSPCDVTKVGLEALSDKSKITPEQKPVFDKFRKAISDLNADFRKMQRTYGGPVGNKLADMGETLVVPESDKIALELYEEKITWGEYLQKRKELNARIQAEVKKITVAN